MDDAAAPMTKGERTRERILAAAVEHFGRLGYRRGSVSAIARELGLSPPAVHAHFPTKEDLFLSALERDAAGLFAIIDERFERPPGPERWGSMVPDLVAEARARPLVRRVLENQEPGMIARLGSMPSMAALTERLRHTFRQGQELGIVRADVAADVLAGGFETILFSLIVVAVQSELVTADPEREAGVAAVLAGGLLDAALRP